ncbi:MAG: multicopper oxidase domain-containing protein [Paracoccaceae bacterium]
MDRIDEKVPKDNTKIWRITIEDRQHPFHVHGGSLWVLSQQSAAPEMRATHPYGIH